MAKKQELNERRARAAAIQAAQARRARAMTLAVGAIVVVVVLVLGLLLAYGLKKNHDKSDGIWLAIAKKAGGKKSVSYVEAVEIALCWG